MKTPRFVVPEGNGACSCAASRHRATQPPPQHHPTTTATRGTCIYQFPFEHITRIFVKHQYIVGGARGARRVSRRPNKQCHITHTHTQKCQQQDNNKISKLYSQRTNKAAQGEASRHPKYVRCHVPRHVCAKHDITHTYACVACVAQPWANKLQLICLQSTHTRPSACRWCPCLFSSILQAIRSRTVAWDAQTGYIFLFIGI